MRENDSTSTVAFHPSVAHRALRFGPFRFDTLERLLWRDGQELRLPPRVLALLEYLIARPGRIVSKQELVDAVWKDAFVSESSLTEAIGLLRQTLGDSAAQATYIQTVHRRGYRFVAPVQVETHVPSTLSAVPALARPAEAGVGQPADEPAGAEAAVAGRRRWIAVAAIAGLVLAAAVLFWPQSGATPRVTRATITLPPDQAPAPGLAAHTVAALSPDGTRIVYVAGSSGDYRLFLRAIDQFEAVPIPGTDGGHGPFFSPDGQSIGFFRSGRLFVARLPQGQPVDIAEAGAGLGGYWHADDTIIYALGGSSGVRRIPAQGGTYSTLPVTGLNPADLRHPSVTADGRHLLATHWQRTVRHSQVVAIDLSTGVPRVLATGVHPREVAAGVVAFIRDDGLMATELSGSGREVSLLSDVMTGVSGAGQFSVAADGTLLYVPSAPARQFRQIRQVTAEGRESVLPMEPRPFINVVVSPDGTRIAASIYERGASDLWVGDLRRGTLDRLTTDGGVASPAWSADGTRVYFSSARAGPFRLHEVKADGSGIRALPTEITEAGPTAAWPDGTLLVDRIVPGRGFDIERVAPDGSFATFQSTTAGDSQARVSPDGRWVAYRSSRSGRSEIYIQSATGRGPNRQVTAHGGVDPDWSADGRSLIFTNRPAVFRIDVSGTGEPVGAPQEIYRSADLIVARSMPTGGLLVLSALDERRPLVTLNVVVNWVAEVRPQLARAGFR